MQCCANPLPMILIYAVLQLSAKKRYLYGAIASIWIVIPAIKITFVALTTDIVQGKCTYNIPVSNNYALQKAIGFIGMLLDYWLPLTLMIFCYARVVLALRAQVILL